MNIFNSLGSNYNLSYVLNSLFTKPDKSRAKLKKFLGEKYSGNALFTYKGRQAIEIALENAKIKKGSGVAVTGFTCIAVVQAIENQDLNPIYLDIDPSTLNFTAGELEKRTQKGNIRAVIIQNTLGYPCDIEGILKICRKYKLVLIEDLAHSIGLTYENGKEAGTLGDFAAFSFSQDKSVDSVSGGALISKKRVKHSNSSAARVNRRDQLYPLLTFLIRKAYPSGLGKIFHIFFKALKILPDPMTNSRSKTFSDWHAGVAHKEFEKLSDTLSHRRRIASIYSRNINRKLLSQKITKSISRATNLRFPIFVENREKLVQVLKRSGVYVSDVWYDSPVAPQKYLGLARYPKSACPNAERVSEVILNLPTHINVTEKDALKISRIINKWAM